GAKSDDVTPHTVVAVFEGQARAQVWRLERTPAVAAMAPFLADTPSPTGSPAGLSPLASASKPASGSSAALPALPEAALARSSSGGWQPWQDPDSTGSGAAAVSAATSWRAPSPMAIPHAVEPAFTSSSESESDASE